jgi:antirestriction protein ArdC
VDHGIKRRHAGDISAAAHAQRAADYLHSLQPKQTEEDRVAA